MNINILQKLKFFMLAFTGVLIFVLKQFLQ